MLVEDIDRLDLIERQKDLSEILRGIELSADEEAEVERMSAAGFDPTLFETPDNGSTNSGPAASKVPAEDWNIFSSSEESPAAFRRLVRTHQLCAAEKQSLQLMVNHLQLQTSALQSKNRQLASAADQLSVEMAETEERCMLQQTKLDDILNFERAGRVMPSVGMVSEELYAAAKNKAKELEVQLIQMREEHSRKEAVSVQHCTKLEAALKGTEMQLLAVSDQLAQRTILYEAQERRWKSSLSGQTALSNERNHELVDLKARFEQLQQQYYQMDCDRTEALLETREIRNALSVFETDRAEERIRLERAEEELSIAVHFTHELQQQLDRVKGTDLTVLEQSMAAENENIRDQFDDRENELLRQLEKARESLLEEKQHREALVDEMQSLHQKNHYFAALLQQLRCGSNGDQAPSNRSLHSFENFSDVEEEGGDGSLTYSDALIETSTSGRPRECTDGCQNPVDETSRGPHRTTIGRSAEEASSTSSASHRDPFVIKSGQVVGLNEEFLTGGSSYEYANLKNDDALRQRMQVVETELENLQVSYENVVKQRDVIQQQNSRYTKQLDDLEKHIKNLLMTEQFRSENEVSEIMHRHTVELALIQAQKEDLVKNNDDLEDIVSTLRQELAQSMAESEERSEQHHAKLKAAQDALFAVETSHRSKLDESCAHYAAEISTRNDELLALNNSMVAKDRQLLSLQLELADFKAKSTEIIASKDSQISLHESESANLRAEFSERQHCLLVELEQKACAISELESKTVQQTLYLGDIMMKDENNRILESENISIRNLLRDSESRVSTLETDLRKSESTVEEFRAAFADSFKEAADLAVKLKEKDDEILQLETTWKGCLEKDTAQLNFVTARNTALEKKLFEIACVFGNVESELQKSSSERASMARTLCEKLPELLSPAIKSDVASACADINCLTTIMSEYASLVAQRPALEDEIQSLKAAEAFMTEKIGLLDINLSQFRDDKKRMETSAKELTSTCADMSTLVKQLEADKADLILQLKLSDSKYSTLKEKTTDLQAEWDAIISQVTEQSTALNIEHDQKIEKLEASLIQSEETIQELKMALSFAQGLNESKEADLQKEIVNDIERRVAFENELNQLKVKLNEYKSKVDDLNARIALQDISLKNEQDIHKRDINEVITRCDFLQRQLADARAEVSVLTIRARDQTDANEALTQQLSSRDAELVQLTTSNDALRHQYGALRLEAQELRQKHAALVTSNENQHRSFDADLRSARLEVEAFRLKCEELSTDNEDLQSALTRKDSSIEALSARIDSLTQLRDVKVRADSLMCQLADARAEVSVLTIRARDQTDASEALTQQLSSRDAELVQLTTSNDALRHQYGALRLEAQELRQKHAALVTSNENQHRSFDADLRSARLEVEAFRLKCEELSTDNEDLQSALTRKDSSIEALNVRLLSLESNLKEKLQQAHESLSMIRKLKERCRDLEVSNTQLRSEELSRNKTVSDLRDSLFSSQKELSRISQEKLLIASQFSELQAKASRDIASVEEKLATNKNRIDELESEKFRLLKQIAVSMSESVSLKESLSISKEELVQVKKSIVIISETLKKENADLESNFSILQMKNKDLHTIVEVLTGKNEDLTSKLISIEQKKMADDEKSIQILREEIDNLRFTTRRLQDELNHHEHLISESRSRYKSLASECDALNEKVSSCNMLVAEKDFELNIIKQDREDLLSKVSHLEHDLTTEKNSKSIAQAFEHEQALFSTISRLQAENYNLLADAESGTHNIKQLEARNADLEKRVKHSTEEILQYKGSVIHLKSALEELQLTHITDLENQKAITSSLEEDYNVAKLELLKTSDRVLQLEQTIINNNKTHQKDLETIRMENSNERTEFKSRISQLEGEIFKLTEESRKINIENAKQYSDAVGQSSLLQTLQRDLKAKDQVLVEERAEKEKFVKLLQHWEANWKGARFHLKEKYRARYAEMHRKFVSEREEMLRLIRDECQDIISEAQLLLIKKRSGMLESFDDSFLRAKPESVFDEHLTTVSSSGIKMPANEFVMTGASFLRQSVESNTSKHSHGTIHAEMLSPKETQDLVRSVLEKVSVNAWKEFQSAYNSGGPSTSSVDFAEEGIN